MCIYLLNMIFQKNKSSINTLNRARLIINIFRELKMAKFTRGYFSQCDNELGLIVLN